MKIIKSLSLDADLDFKEEFISSQKLKMTVKVSKSNFNIHQMTFKIVYFFREF